MKNTSRSDSTHHDNTLLRRGVERLDQAFTVLDENLRLIASSQGFSELLAFPEELCRPGTHLSEFFRYNAERGEYGEGDIDEQVRTRVELARRGEPHCIERVRPNGTVLEIRGNPIPNGGFVTSYLDITERRRAEQAIRETENRIRDSEQRLRATFEYTPAAIVIADSKGTVVQENKAFRRLLGYGAEELQTLNWWNLFDAKAHAYNFMKHQELLEGKIDHYRSVRRYIAKDGTYVWGDATTSALYNEHRELEYTIDVILDITEQKQAEERMLESEARYRTLTESVPCAIYRAGTKDVLSFEFVSSPIEAITGYTAIEFMQNLVRSYGDVIHPVDRSRVERELRTAIEQSLPWNLEYRIQHADGSLRWVTDQGQLHFDDQGGITHRNGFLLDDTQRHWAQEEQKAHKRLLDNNLKLLHLVLNSIPASVYWKDRDSVYLGCNQKYARDAGYESPDEIVGREDKDTTWRKDAAQIREDDLIVINSRIPKIGIEEVYETRHGDQAWLRTNKTPVVDAEDKVIGILGTCEDITAQKQAEHELSHLRNLLSNIVDSMPSVLIGVDAEGFVTQWNKRAEAVAELTASQAAGQRLDGVFPRLGHLLDTVREAIRSGIPQTQTKMAHREGDAVRYSDVTIYPLVTNGAEGAVIRVDDVTDRVLIEELMLQSEKMLSVGNLAAGMAHEINNPLAGIVQNMQVIKNRLSNKLPKNMQVAEACGLDLAALQEYLHQRGILQMIEGVNESGRKASRIVSNMLSFSQNTKSHFTRNDLTELLDRAVELVTNDYESPEGRPFGSIRIQREYAEDLPKVWCEGNQIQQVFVNLLMNASDALYSAEIGEPQLRLSVCTRSETAVVEIADNGPGMDGATSKRVFEPFYTTKEVGVGTGLGLSVSYYVITQNHGGLLNVVSEPGKGACFTIELPVSGPAQ